MDVDICNCRNGGCGVFFFQLHEVHLILMDKELFCTSELSMPLISLQQTIQECLKQMNMFYS